MNARLKMRFRYLIYQTPCLINQLAVTQKCLPAPSQRAGAEDNATTHRCADASTREAASVGRQPLRGGGL